MTAAKPSIWRDLTGQSDRWLRTVLLAVIVGRISLVAVASVLVLAFGEGVAEGFSGLNDDLDREWVIIGLIVAPVVESLGIALVVWLLGGQAGWQWPVWATALTCGALSVPLHGLSLLSLAVAPFFSLMAMIQHHWLSKGRAWKGIALITVIHAVANAAGLGAMALMT